MKLSVIIPVYNERNTIEKAINEVLSSDLVSLNIEKEIIVVDDYSTDGTREFLKEYQKNSKIQLIYHEKNRGKGSAVRTGYRNATGDILIIQDADLEYDPKEFRNLLKPILEGSTSVVYGSRLMKTAQNPCIYKRYYWGNKTITCVVNVLFGSNLTDSYTCYKVIKNSVLNGIKLNANGFEFEAEITAKLLKKGYKITEVPISYSPRSLEQGKKIGWKDAVKGIITLLICRFF